MILGHRVLCRLGLAQGDLTEEAIGAELQAKPGLPRSEREREAAFAERKRHLSLIGPKVLDRLAAVLEDLS